MQAYKLTTLAAAILLLGACATTTQPARSASGVSLEVLDACNRLTADYLYNKVAADASGENEAETNSSSENPTTYPLVTTDDYTADPVITRCLDIIDREMQAQAYILGNSSYSSGYATRTTTRTYWQPADRISGYYSPYRRAYYNQLGYPYQTRGHHHRHRNPAPRPTSSHSGNNSGNVSPPPSVSPPPPPPPRAAPAPRPQSARTYTPPRSRTNPSVPKQRE